jgi:2-C-methyl-D-erythritol 4-phosphate cytidylyltransferase
LPQFENISHKARREFRSFQRPCSPCDSARNKMRHYQRFCFPKEILINLYPFRQFIFFNPQNHSVKKFAVIVAAGSGKRMGKAMPKQFLLLNEKPVLLHTLDTFLNAFDDLEIILVVAGEYIADAETISQSASDSKRIKITTGGDTRFHSVKNGLEHVVEESIVFVHDGVRCLITEKLIHRCFDAAMEKGNAVPAIKPVDSMRVETHHGNVIIDRDKVHIIQTPQTFKSQIIKAAFEQDYHESFTDEATVIEIMGEQINLIEGETNNIKITQPIDLMIAERILASMKYEL